MDTSQQATVIIPCFNVEDYIKDCLDSVLLQGDSVHETYVVDNNSTDKTMEVVRAWHHAHPTFPLYLIEEKKPGAPAARNHPLALVKTEWVQFLDADDVLFKNKIKDQITQFPDAHVICAGAIHLALDGSKSVATPEPNIPLALIKGAAGITSSNLFSTAHLCQIKGWDETLKSSQEYDLMFRLWKVGAIFVVDSEARTCIQERPSGQISQRDPIEKWTRFIDLRVKMLDDMLKANTSEYEKQEMLQVIFDFVRILFPLDFEKAAYYYRLLKTIGLKPKRSATCSWKYIFAIRILGVVRTEKIRLQTPNICVRS